MDEDKFLNLPGLRTVVEQIDNKYIQQASEISDQEIDACFN
jgi:hypothetical protein